MSDLPEKPELGPRAINAYNRLITDLVAFNHVLSHTRASGPVTSTTLLTLNGLIICARRLFKRHPDIPIFFPVGIGQTMTLTDLNIYVARLKSASLQYERRHAPLRGSLRRAFRKFG